MTVFDDSLKGKLAFSGVIVGSALLFSLLVFVVAAIIGSPKEFDVNGRHVVITGGSMGIGKEVAKEYIRRGAHVTIVARNKKVLEEAKKELEASRPNITVTIISCDLSGESDHVASTLKEGMGGRTVDVIVNCAGTSWAEEFITCPTSQFKRLFDINVMSAVNVTKALLPDLISKKSGRIVFVASQVAQVSIHGYSAYGASKWALRGLAQSLQQEVKPYGIYVSVAYPPDTDTPGYAEEMKSKPRITAKLSETGSVFPPLQVAKDIIDGSNRGYHSVSTGFDGWMLSNLTAGFGPCNHLWEVYQQVLFASLFRLISAFIAFDWDSIISKEVKSTSSSSSSSSSGAGSSSTTSPLNDASRK